MRASAVVFGLTLGVAFIQGALAQEDAAPVTSGPSVALSPVKYAVRPADGVEDDCVYFELNLPNGAPPNPAQPDNLRIVPCLDEKPFTFVGTDDGAERKWTQMQSSDVILSVFSGSEPDRYFLTTAATGTPLGSTGAQDFSIRIRGPSPYPAGSFVMFGDSDQEQLPTRIDGSVAYIDRNGDEIANDGDTVCILPEVPPGSPGGSPMPENAVCLAGPKPTLPIARPNSDAPVSGPIGEPAVQPEKSAAASGGNLARFPGEAEVPVAAWTTIAIMVVGAVALFLGRPKVR